MPIPLPQLTAIALAVVNCIAFALMAVDKLRAKRKARNPRIRRVSEKALFLWAVFGGGAGGTLGMLLFRHKTRRWYFRFGFPLLALLQIGLALWLYLAQFPALAGV